MSEEPVAKCPFCGANVYCCPDQPGIECETEGCNGYWPQWEDGTPV